MKLNIFPQTTPYVQGFALVIARCKGILQITRVSKCVDLKSQKKPVKITWQVAIQNTSGNNTAFRRQQKNKLKSIYEPFERHILQVKLPSEGMFSNFASLQRVSVTRIFKKKVKHICFPFISLLFIPEETLYHLDVKNPKGLHRNNGI